jgi:hypothetical protein
VLSIHTLVDMYAPYSLRQCNRRSKILIVLVVWTVALLVVLDCFRVAWLVR